MAKRRTKKKKKGNFRSGLIKIVRVGLLLSCVGILLFAYISVRNWYQETDMFNLAKIIVKNEYMLTKGEIIALSQVQRGMNVLELNRKEIREKIIASPYIAEVEIEVVLPATLILKVKEEKPLAFILKKGKLKFVGERGQLIGVINPQKSYNLPVLNGSKIIKEQIDFLNQAKKLSPFVAHQISEIREGKQGIVISLVQNSAEIIIGRERFAEKIVILENFLQEESENICFSKIDYIDLRFEKQVVLKEIEKIKKS